MRVVVKMLIVLLFSAVMAGCELGNVKPVEQHIVYVDKIVQADPPKPAEVAKPLIPVLVLSGKESDDEVLKAYVASVRLLKSYSEQLEAALQPYIDAYNAAQAAKEKAAVVTTPPQGK